MREYSERVPQGTRLRRAVAALLVGGLLTGCSPTSGARPPGNESLDQLRSKLPLLEVDECYSGDPVQVFPRCDKFVTELASTIGALRDQLAPRGAQQRAGIDGLQKGIDEYQRQACGSAGQSRTAEQSSRCPRALMAIRGNLDALQRFVATLPQQPSAGTP